MADALSLEYFNDIRARNVVSIVTAALGNVPLTLVQAGDYKSKAPFGQLPLLHVGAKYAIAQSVAIANAIARRGKILGETDEEMDITQMLLQQYEDMYSVLPGARHGRFTWKDALETHFPKHIQNLEKLVRDNSTFSGKYLAGEAAIFAVLFLYLGLNPKVLDSAPKLKKFYDSFHALPQIQPALKTLEGLAHFFKAE